MFGPSSSHDGLLCRLLTSVPFASSLRDTTSHVVPLFCRVLVIREYRSHRVIRYTFLLTCCIYIDFFRVSIGLWMRGHPCPKKPLPLMHFLFVRSAFCIQLSSDPISRWTPLLSLMVLLTRAHKGLSPSSLTTYRSHPQATRKLVDRGYNSCSHFVRGHKYRLKKSDFYNFQEVLRGCFL
jgi:hypothetical protein